MNSSFSTQFLKQYTCYQLTNFMKGNYTPQATLKIPFTGSTLSVYHELRHEIIDSMGDIERMYICKWMITNSGATTLDLFQYQSNVCHRIEMSSKPLFINIVVGYLYIVGGNSLYVISLSKFQIENSYVLGSDTIHEVQPSYSQSNFDSLGVCIYTWNDRKGYRKRFYNEKNGTEDKWWSNLTAILSSKAPQSLVNSTLKVIIPGVLGLIILPSLDEICLLNLTTMQTIEHCTCKLSGWTIARPYKTIVKHHANEHSQGFDDSLLISIGEVHQQMFEIFIFHIKYIRQIIERFPQQQAVGSQRFPPSIGTLTSAQPINWSECALQNYVTFSTEGNLVDYLLTQTGVIYYSNTPSSKIPISNFITYQNPLENIPILTLEHNICQSFIEDLDAINRIEQIKSQRENNDECQYYQKRLKNSILRPNRYSIPFLQTSTGEEIISQIDSTKIKPQKLLFDWYKLYRVKSIQTLNRDIIILRSNSISSLLPITNEQYQKQYQSGKRLVEYFMNNSDGQGKKPASFEMSINSEYFSDKLPFSSNIWTDSIWGDKEDINSQAFTYEKPGLLQNSKYDENNFNNQHILNQSQLYCSTYQKFITYFLSRINIHHSQQLPIFVRSPSQDSPINYKSLIFSKDLIINRVKDILHFYAQLLKYLYDKTSQLNYLQYSYPQTEKLLLNYLGLLRKLLIQSDFQVSAHGCDLIEMFAVQEVAKLHRNIEKNQREGRNYHNNENVNIIVNVEEESWKIVANIFDDIILETAERSNHKGVFINTFIKMLLHNINSNFEYIQEYLQIFNPYPSATSLFTLESYTNPYASNLTQLEKSIFSISREESHFPLTPTLLSIYCFLPVSDETKQHLISRYTLARLINRMDEKAINKLLNGLIATRNFKDKIKNIYLQATEGKQNYQDMINTLKSQKINRPEIMNENVQNFYDSIEEEYKEDEIDNSRGIIYLSKILDPEVLENHLSKLKDEDLEMIFRVTIEAALDKNMSKSKSLQIKSQYTNQDILVGWVFKYRTYIKKFRELISRVQNSINNRQGEQINELSTELKKKAFRYIYNSYHSLENVKICYLNLYKNSNSMANSHQNIQDEEIIEKVCCRMIGLENVSQLYLYAVFNESFENENVTPHKILPQTQFLALILDMLKDDNTSVQSVSNVTSIAFYFLHRILDDPYNHVNIFKKLGKYFSRRDLSKLILQNGVLKKKFQALESDEVCLKIKGYFGYNEVLKLTNGNYYYKSQIRSSSQHGSKINKTASKRNVGSSSQDQSQRPQENIYEILSFRNAYLQALGQ